MKSIIDHEISNANKENGLIWQNKEACLNHIRQLEVGDRLSILQLVDYILFMNPNYESMLEKIEKFAASYYLLFKKFGFFELINIPAFILESRVLHEDRIIDYKKRFLETHWYPPVVLEEDLEFLIDGNHRVSALKEAGEKWILGFKGITK